MQPGDIARQYHALSSYAPERDFGEPIDHPLVVQGFVGTDYSTWPAQLKTYPDELPVVALPREWPPAGERPLDLATLARLLYLSAGVVRVNKRPGRPKLLLRAAGSAGGRFPLELYLAARGVDGLEDGVHWYDPVAHALKQIGPAPGGEATTLVVTGVPWRTAWRYAERGFRHIYWDAGTMLAQTLALAEWGRLWTRFPDAQIAELVGADGDAEFPVALVGLAPGRLAVEPTGPAQRGTVTDAATVDFPLIPRAQHAGDSNAFGDPWPAALRLDVDPPDLDTVILNRGSTRRMDPNATVPRATFEVVLATGLRGTQVPHFVAAHGVDDLEPGLYRWPDLDRPLLRGPLRERMLRVCWDQDLGRDAAFVVLSAVDLEPLDDRGYREAQLDGGIAEGRLHLAAYALGIGASGMTFLDSEIEPLLGEPLAGLIATCVGVPAYRRKSGGRPGAPAAVYIPAAGLTPPEG